jgi:hypothetical protein
LLILFHLEMARATSLSELYSSLLVSAKHFASSSLQKTKSAYYKMLLTCSVLNYIKKHAERLYPKGLSCSAAKRA